MSWFSKIFEKKQKENKEKIRMSLKDVDDFLRDRFKKEYEPLENSTKRQIEEEYENLQQVVEKMKSQVKILKEAPYSESNDSIIIRKAVGSRKSFVNKMEMLIAQIQKPIGIDMNSMINFHNETAKLINITNAKTVKEYAFLKELFRDEGKKIIETFHQIIEIDRKIGTIIKEFKNSNPELLEAKEILADILNSTQRLLKNENKIHELDRTLEKAKDKNEKIENELKKLLNSSDWKIFLQAQKSREQIKMLMQNKKTNFIELIAKLEKPLKKYNWSVKNKILDNYIHLSFESILAEDPKGQIFMSQIKNMKKDMLDKKINFKNNDKFLAIIEEMIENNEIERILQEYSNLSENLKIQEEKITSNSISKRKRNLEIEINKSKKQIQEIINEKERIRNEIKSIQIDREHKLKKLEELLNVISNKKIFLEIN
ncbi:MAG: hypothetical protein J7J93_01390 [Candidatus Aenigmarchaeota archaeon]|nr:hypothetical protein [Candidatus Aenigmarchaeota archaeon]